MDRQRSIGLTKTVGYQVGVRKTFPISQQQAWSIITAEEGLNAWFGGGENIILVPGCQYHTKAGTGEIRIVKPLLQLRFTWQKEGWQRPSTVQIRILSKESNKTTISFHQEHLSNQQVREEMKRYWEAILETIEVSIQKM
ncbi:SRPBCC domain-containing protein [Lysinibacillus sp. fkY74-1]|uniref:SRPBCC family protein n=1 Tax=Lysinibacillus TaxID=400634 RepID=UPI00056B6766|nr:SRPBCC domain-containing protein [Lysinibacillus sphaericus]MEB7453456.1 SRPBCC domain-containing protein [Lysinibacillus sphaericus]QPA52929.1 SRPBCC domain-containing protein [Lysinibacillus sphaericus]QTB20908.1 SRPBCC domain-containing protein [Lysinibacillus sphaericus]QTB25437.1 SRPBCC domain-containing protein [Lysinibacillus sphaericus]